VHQRTELPETVPLLFSARAAWPAYVYPAGSFASTGGKSVTAAGMFLSHDNSEFFELSAAARGSLYPALPDWLAEVEVITDMAVPFLPS
jgi:hypothetical protein